MKTFTWAEILKLDINKGEFAKKIGIECPFDTALPQEWLNDFVKRSGLEYHKVLWSTFAAYPKDQGMRIVSGWDEVQNLLDKEVLR